MAEKLPDPRVVFALAVAISAFGIIFRSARQMACVLLVVVLCALMLGVHFPRLFGRLKRLWQAAVMMSLLQSLFAPAGRVLLRVLDVPVLTAGGLDKGLTVLFRLAAFITVGAIIALYPSRALIQGMVQIKLPYEIAYMVSVGVRFVPQMGAEFKDSLTALQLRGVVIEEIKLRERVRLYSYLLLPMVAGSLKNAQELALSMEMRAFRAMKERTSCYKLTFSGRDKALLAAVVLFAAAVAAAIFSGIIPH